ncbi:MAG TPA: hypothetical protein VF717_09320 [Pyrinomonadaceae bacterium]|jgi:hypothetical protein
MSNVEVNLRFGYTGPDQVRHSKVVFGRRLTGRDLFEMSEEEGFDKETQSQLMMLGGAITSFGDLRMPVPMTVLMSLNRPDRMALARGYNAFLLKTAGGRKPKQLSDSKIQLPFPFTRGGVEYDVVEFGTLIDAYMEGEADELEGLRKNYLIIGKEISELSQSEGTATMKGPVPLDMFEGLDAISLFALAEKESGWLNSFRAEGEEEESLPANYIQADAGNRHE